jgi:hypothetical protein
MTTVRIASAAALSIVLAGPAIAYDGHGTQDPPKPPRAEATLGTSMPTEAAANKAIIVLRNMTVSP